MNILSLIESQIEKNKLLTINTDLSTYKLWARKHLELQVKLGVLAEETNCYKYLLTKECSTDKNLTLHKYIDFLSCVLSFGIDKEYTNEYELVIKSNDYCLSDQFLNLYIDINDLIISPSQDHYYTLLEDTLSLGVTLGYSEEQIKNAHIYNN